MRQISELEITLNHFLKWNKARISFLIQILQALFIVRTVNLTQVAQAFCSSAKEESVYEEFKDFSKTFLSIGALLFFLIASSSLGENLVFCS